MDALARCPILARNWTAIGERLILDLLAQEHAAVLPEIDAKLGDRRHPWPGQSLYVDPHYLTSARQSLIRAEMVKSVTAATRGGRKVTVVHLANTAGQVRAVDRAVRRKRLLHARYLSWATSSKRNPRGLLGPAGELVTHKSLTQAAPYGYALLRPEGGEVATALGGPVPGGKLDSGAFLTTVDTVTGAPRSPVLVPIEVKNRRQTTYPRHADVHQLLYKAARLQQMHPDQPILPVFVCRRGHFFLTQMADELGFQVIAAYSQPVLPYGIDEGRFAEVRDESAPPGGPSRRS